jgi:hypothetical protein
VTDIRAFRRPISLADLAAQRGAAAYDYAVHLASATFFATIFLAIVAGPLLVARQVPGDLGDARFNLYILEHIYQWLAGSESSLFSPEMFYPFPDTLFFSDTHAGSALVYSFFRALGISEYEAFDLWFFTGYLTTFIAAYYALARMGAGFLSAGLGATIFAFSLPSLAQFGHAQLVYRCGVPLALLYLWLGVRTGAVRYPLVAVIWLCLQTLMSVYLGVFLYLLMTALALALIIGDRKSQRRLATCWHTEPGSSRFVLWPNATNGTLIAVLLVFVVITAALLYGHARVSRTYELTRSWDEIASMLPRPGSYLLMDPLPYWNQITAWIGTSIPMQGEHNMFIGLGALGFCLAGIAGLARSSEKAISIMPARAMLAAGAATALLMTIFGSISLYRIFALAAGFNAIRAGTRIILVLMFPVAVIAAFGLRTLIGDVRPRALGVSAALLLALLTTYEICAIVKPVFSAAEANRRTDAIIAAARSRGAGISQPILAVIEPGETWYVVQLDAMMAALRLGWPTVNGYSGNFVPGWTDIPNPTCDMATRQFATFATWRKIHDLGPDVDEADLLQRTISVSPPDCSRIAAFER